jgi:PDZ domain-containing secreted protein/Zn-dependent protease
MESSFTLLRVRGIPIGAHWTWLFFAGLLTLSLTSTFPRTYPGLPDGTYIGMAAVTAVLFFASILLHELGHAFRALKEGMRIEGITLWLFGGVARFSGMFPSPGAEFRIAIAGPIVSVVLGVAFGGAALAANALGAAGSIRGIVDYLARINLVLVGFNMVPALPLDGGRVLRSWLWHRQRSFAAATMSAAKAGRAFSALLIGIGLLGFVTGAGTGGLWFVFIGWFLLQAGQAEASFAVMRQAFHGVRVRDLMTQSHEDAAELTVSPDDPVLEALTGLQSAGRALVVEEGEVVGVLRAADVAQVLESARLRPEPGARRAGAGVWVVVGVLMLAAAAFLFHPPVAVIRPGVAVDVSRDITITGVPVSKPTGRYLLTAVRLDQPSAIGVLYALVRRDADVLPLSAVIPRGVDERQYLRRQRALFRESRTVAAAAGARAAGLPVTLTGTGATVTGVVEGSPADAALDRGDVIIAIDGRPVMLASEIGGAIGGRPAGTAFRLTIERDGKTREVSVRSAHLPRTPEGVARIGILLETRGLDVKLPFEVKFRNRDVAGPSAGLAYALAIADILDGADLAKGRTVAVTGTIDVDGRVGEVGGVREKAAAARAKGAKLFIVPQAEVDEARGVPLDVRGVSTISDALGVLRA